MKTKKSPRFQSVLLSMLLLLGGVIPLLAATEPPPASTKQLLSLAGLETAFLLRGRGVAHEEAGRLESAVRSFEESLLFFPDAEVGKRIVLLKKEIQERATPLSQPAPLLVEARAVRLERARELREEGKRAFVRSELRDAARFFEESLALFEDEALSRFVDGMKKEMELALSLEGLDELFD